MSLSLYNPLTSNDPEVRLNAARQLTSELFDLINPPAASESSTVDAKDVTDTTSIQTTSATKKPPKEEISYAINRLIKGLASGRESARPGFAVVLTEVLGKLLAVSAEQQAQHTGLWDVQKVLGLVHKHMEITEHLSRAEERDKWLGRLFGLKAVVMCGALFEANGQDEEDMAKEREFRTIVGELLSLGAQKSWLREPAMWTLVSAAREFEGRGFGRTQALSVWKLVQEHGMAKTSEGVGVWLALEELFPGVLKEGADGGWGKDGPLTMGNLAGLARALKEAGANDKKDGEATSKGVWSAKLHWVWDIILAQYLHDHQSTPNEGKSDKKKGKKSKKDETKTTESDSNIAPFSDFWRVVVDGNFSFILNWYCAILIDRIRITVRGLIF